MIYTIVLHDVPLKMCNQNTPPDFLRCQKMRYSHPRYKYDHNQKIQHINKNLMLKHLRQRRVGDIMTVDANNNLAHGTFLGQPTT